MLKHGLLLALGMATCAVSCWPEAAVADPCGVIVNPQIVPPKANDLMSKLKELIQIVAIEYGVSKKLAKDNKDFDATNFATLVKDAGDLLGLIEGPPDINAQFATLQQELHDISVDLYLVNASEQQSLIALKVAEWNGVIRNTLDLVQSYAGQYQPLPEVLGNQTG